MKKRKKKLPKKEEKLRVNPELEGLYISINSLGEIQTNVDVDEINEFLNKNVKDKKLQ